MKKILIRCAGRHCQTAVFAPMDEPLLMGTLMKHSWVFVATHEGFQPVCWPCAEGLEISPEDLARVKKAHAIAQGRKSQAS